MEKVTRFVLLLAAAVVTAIVLTYVSINKLEKYRNNGAENSQVTLQQRERQLDCLAKNIYYEAGSESFEGKVAVAQVTLNRAESGKFPDDICRVIYQKNVVYEKVICQFSWYCDTSARVRPIHTKMYDESYAVAKKVLLENFRLDGLKEAMYYHADYVSPGWNKPVITKIGRHIFYKG